MNVGQFFVIAAFATALVGLVAKGWALRTGVQWADSLYRRNMVAAAVLLSAAFLYLCLLFLFVDVSVLYVWTYTGTWIPWEYRLAGAWTGREGSLLLWTAFTAVVIAVMAFRDRIRSEMDDAERRARAWTDLVMAALLVAFLLAVVRQGTFAPTDGFLLAGRPNGNGLNPLLINPYILIHPPMMFLAYAMTVVPAAAGISHMITGTGRWSHIAGRASRINWVLYTFAMGLGGMWAYYTLGFGGYWAWDPVEVANLLPWLALTVYLHAQMMHGCRGWFAGIGPMLAVLPFLLTVFSTVSTRSGLWVSVHAFTDPTNTFNPDAAARLLGILEVDASLLPYFGILVGLFLVSLALWCRRLALDHGVMRVSSQAIAGLLAFAGGMAWVAPALLLSLVFEAGSLVGSPGLGALGLLGVATLAAASPSLVGADEPGAEGRKQGWRRFVDIAPLAGLAVLLLALLLLVSLMWHFAAVNGWSEAFWDARVPWLMTPVILALVVLMLRGRGKKQALIGAGALLAGGLAAFTIGGLPYYSVFMAGGFLLATLDKMKAVSFAGDRPTRWGSTFLWGAALLDLAFWVDPPTHILGGLLRTSWPIHLLMIPLAVAAVVGAHLVGNGRRMRWPYVLAALLGGYYVAPALALAAWFLHRRAPVSERPFVLKRVRPIGVYGVHFAVAVLVLGYAMSTYFEAEAQHVVETDGTFDVGAGEYATRLVAEPPQGRVETFALHAGKADGTVPDGPPSTLSWEPQTGTYRTLPGVLRLWNKDVYVSLEAVCVEPLEDGACPAGGWVSANEAVRPVFLDGPPSAARITALSLPGINLVWAGLALFVLYGLPVAGLLDPGAVHRPQRSKAARSET